MKLFRIALLTLVLAGNGFAGEPLRIAVASSFRPTLEKILQRFEEETAVTSVVSSGATGLLYAQIINGAGFDLLLAADSWRPTQLVKQGLGRARDQRTYALGKLVLAGPPALSENASRESIVRLLQGKAPRIALANPATAPYGLAARQTLEELGLWQSTSGQRVTAQNAAQAMQYYTTGNSDFAFISLAQWRNWQRKQSTGLWLIPQSYYQPLKHDALVIGSSNQTGEAQRFLDFLTGKISAQLLREDGYEAYSDS